MRPSFWTLDLSSKWALCSSNLLPFFYGFLIYIKSVRNNFSWIQDRRMGAWVIRVGWNRGVFRDGREMWMIAWNGPGSKFPWKDFKSWTFSLLFRLIILTIFTIKCFYPFFVTLWGTFCCGLLFTCFFTFLTLERL